MGESLSPANPTSVPATVAAAAAVLRAAPVPAEVLHVLRTLQGAGYAAVLVGGAVRDVLLGRGSEDFDVATAARPEQVQALFPRTIPTGIDHGTVTVLAGRTRRPVEVTTFRGDGTYADGRRPDRVEFLDDLAGDLARRDFTVNAFAWDPVHGRFTDAFDGLADLRARIVRAIGDPLARFREDGLRTMRAVRFCSTLEFSLDPATAAAIPRALTILDKVAVERVRVELWKLLEAPRPDLGLEPMAATGIWSHVLPALDEATRAGAIERVAGLPRDPVLRLCALLEPVARRDGAARALQAVARLKPSRAELARARALLSDDAVRFADAARDQADAAAVRRLAAALGRAHLKDALALYGVTDPVRARALAACAGAPLAVADLAIRGGDLVAAGIVPRGPEVGQLLRTLLARAMADPTLNEAPRLLELARELADEPG